MMPSICGRAARRSCSRRPRSRTRRSRCVCRRVSGGRTAGPATDRTAIRGQPGSAAAVQPPVERHGGARALGHRIPRLVCGHAGPEMGNADANAPSRRTAYINKPRPFPQYPTSCTRTTAPAHDYHGVTFGQRHFSKGLFFQVAYTAGTKATRWTGSPRHRGPVRPRSRARSRSATPPSLDDRRDVRPSFGHDRKWLSSAPWLLDLALGGWISTGRLSADRDLSDADDFGSRSDWDPVHHRRDATGIAIRPDQLGDPSSMIPRSTAGSTRRAFAAPPVGRSGTADAARSKVPD